MQFNAASASSSSAASATAATHNCFDAAVDVDGFKIPQLPLAGPGHKPITSLIFTKNTDSLFSSKGGKQKESAQITENVRFPTPEDSGDDHEGGDVEDNIRPSLRPRSHMQSPPRPGRSVAPSLAPKMLPQLSEYIERLYALEAEQAEEIRTLAKEVLFAAYQTFLSTPGDLAGQYCKRIAELLGEGVESRVVEDVEDIKETRRLPERQPAWDFGSLGASRTTDTSASVATPKRSSMPPPAFVPSRKRLREEDSLEDVLEVENSLLLSRNPSIGTISSSGDSPASKRPRLETYVPTVDEREDDAMLGLIWGWYFQSAADESDNEEYLPKDEKMEEIDEDDSGSDMEVEEEDLSIFALTRGLPDDVIGFIEEAALHEADRLAEESAAARPPSPPPTDSFPMHSFGTAEERPPVPPPRPAPLAPKRLQRSNERVTINEDGSIEAFDYTQTEEYADRMAWERHLFVIHGGSSAFDNRRGPCDLAADLREITQVGPGGKLLNCHRWQYRFDEQAWRYFEVS